MSGDLRSPTKDFMMFPVRATIIATVAAAAVCIAAAASAFDIKLNPFSAIKNAVEAAAEDRSAAEIATDRYSADRVSIPEREQKSQAAASASISC
jgi:hypothetical protein